jgi:hypothetical protein
MKLELKVAWLKKLAKLGGTEFNDFDYLTDERFGTIDIERCTEKDIELILKIVQDAKAEGGARAVVTKINLYKKVKADPGGVKITRLEQLATALKTYIAKSPHKWVFCDNEDEQTVPFYVVMTHYTPPNERDGHPASTHMKLSAVRGGQKSEQTVTWHSDELGKSVVELLNEAGYYLETEGIVKDYMAELAEYRKLSALTGEQFLGSGYAFGGERYSRSVVSMVRDGAPSKLVMDDGVDDEDTGRRKTYSDVVVNGSFWTEKPKDGRNRRDDDDDEAAVAVPAHPYMSMFDLAKHQFVSIHVNNITPYVYDSTLIEKLVLPQERKDLVSILIGGADMRMDDIIKGKTGGIIVISTGPPGTGKTLTSEVFAEEMKRPLYAVQCSQLGTDEESLEKELQRVLRRATRWRAILLVDEADVYVHARGEDIQQNAIVGVFLRVLEYYRGVLFMTSNRETIIDDAILSRATAWIKYEYPDEVNLKKIWKVLSAQYGIPLEDGEIDKLVKSEKIKNPSGRSVKNLLKLAKLLSAKNKEKVGLKLIEYVSQFIALDKPEEGKT